MLTHYRVVKEETLESQGALDNMTFDEYVDANSNVTEQQVPTDLSQLVAAATGTSPVEVTEMEPELSVEDLLATTQDNAQTLEEIELEDKSDTRIMIEKFVDENPEAVALLLRNWINEDWGAM